MFYKTRSYNLNKAKKKKSNMSPVYEQIILETKEKAQ